MRVLTLSLVLACAAIAACGGDDTSVQIASPTESLATPTPMPTRTPMPTPTPAPVESYCEVAAELHDELDDPRHDVTVEEVGTLELEREIAAVWNERAPRLAATAPSELKDDLAAVDRYHDALLSGEEGVEADTALLRVLDYHETRCVRGELADR